MEKNSLSLRFACFFKLLVLQSLLSFHQVFTETSVGLSTCTINKMISLQSLTTVSLNIFLRLFQSHLLLLLLLLLLFFEMNDFPNHILKKIILLLKLFLDQRLSSLEKLFNRISVGPSEWTINKIITRKAKSQFQQFPEPLWQINFLKWISFQIRFVKKFIVLEIKLSCIVKG